MYKLLYADPTVSLIHSNYTVSEGPHQEDITICAVLEGPSGGLAPGESVNISFLVVQDTASKNSLTLYIA